MAFQTENLDVRRDVSLPKTGEAIYRFDMVGFGVLVRDGGHPHCLQR